MKKSKVLIILSIMISIICAGCGKAEEKIKSTKDSKTETTKEVKDMGSLMMATTTSTADTGLLDYLAPLFKADTGYTLEWNAVGTGEALKLGEDGQVDVVLVHAKASEEEFVANGYGEERFPVMYNDFIVVGPKEPIEKNEDIATVFKQITDLELPFINRGDDSGTDKKEKKIWETLAIDPTVNPNYIQSGQGMGATLTMAEEKQAYCLSDRGTYLKQKKDASIGMELEIICEGSKDLLNQYGVIAVSPEKYPDINNKGANVFIKWICSEKVQKLIGEFGIKEYGEALFTPNAETDS